MLASQRADAAIFFCRFFCGRFYRLAEYNGLNATCCTRPGRTIDIEYTVLPGKCVSAVPWDCGRYFARVLGVVWMSIVGMISQCVWKGMGAGKQDEYGYLRRKLLENG